MQVSEESDKKCGPYHTNEQKLTDGRSYRWTLIG